MKLQKTIVGGLATLVVLSGVFGLNAPAPVSAAGNNPSFAQLKDALELLRGNMLRLKEQTGSSTRPFEERKMKNASSTKPVREEKMRHGSSTKAVDRTCMQEAVNTREEAIMAAFKTFNDSTMRAMEKRQTAFASVWTNSNISNQGKYNSAWTTWKKDTDAARKQLNKDRVSAWKTFRTTATQSCKATLPKAESEEQELGTTAI